MLLYNNNKRIVSSESYEFDDGGNMNRLLMFVFSRRAVLRNDLSRSEVHAIRLNNVFVFCLFFVFSVKEFNEELIKRR